MELLLKTGLCAVSAGILALVIKKSNPEIAALMGFAAAAVILYAACGQMSQIMDFLRNLAERAGIDSAVFGIILKTIAVTVVTRLASDACRDAGHTASSSAIEFFGSVTVLCMAIPIFEVMMQMIDAIV